MSRLLNLPTEVLRLILSALLDTDIRSFFAARLTCKTFQDVITDILKISVHEHTPALHTFLTTNFAPLLNSSNAERQPDGKHEHQWDPLHSLPWVSNESVREKWLRPEASWLRIPLVTSEGKVVRRMQVVQCERQEFGTEYCEVNGYDAYFRVEEEDHHVMEELRPAGGVTIGGLWDLLVSAHPGMGPPIKRWELKLGERVRDLEEFERVTGRERPEDLRDPTISREGVEALYVEDEEYAVLVVVMEWDSGFFPIERLMGLEEEEEEEGRDEGWYPDRIEDDATMTGRFDKSTWDL